MEPWSEIDLVVYALGAIVLVATQQGPIALLILLAGAAPFFLVVLPIKLVRTYLRQWDYQPPFVRRSSGFEVTVALIMRWFLRNLNSATVGHILFGKRLSLWMYHYRRIRYGIEDLGDVDYKPVKTDLYSGYWVVSPSRGTQHDLVVYMVPGNALGCTSAYFYVEFVGRLLVSLLEQGFTNPAVFVLDVNFSELPLRTAVGQVMAGWEVLHSEHPDATKVALGSSVGATSLLTLLIHRVQPLKMLPPVLASKPDAVVLISPLPKLAKVRVDERYDYICNAVVARFVAKTLDPMESTKLYAMPGLLRSEDWWRRALPEFGIYINCGSEETLAGEIEQMYTSIRPYGKVYLDVEPAEIHAWPISTYYSAHTKAAATIGVDKLAGQVARMVLWHTTSKKPEVHEN